MFSKHEPGTIAYCLKSQNSQLLQNKKVIEEKKHRGFDIYSLTPKSDRLSNSDKSEMLSQHFQGLRYISICPY